MPREIRFFNTLTRRVEVFHPLEPGHVRMYTCGPTVYNFVHIGNLRTFLFEDVLRRTLAAFGYRVTQVMNLTDIDDKTIKGAAAEGVSLREFTDRYVAAFFADIDALGDPARRALPARHRLHPAAGRTRAEADGAGAHLRAGRLDLLPHRDVPRLRQALGPRPRRGQGRRPRRRRRVREGGRARLRALEGRQARRAGVGDGARPRAARAGTWSAPPWGWRSSARASTSTPARWTTSFPTTRTRSPRARGRPASRSSAPGCTPSTSSSKGRRWRSRLGNFFTLRDLLEKGYDPLAIRYLLVSVPYRQKLNFTFDGLHAAAARASSASATRCGGSRTRRRPAAREACPKPAVDGLPRRSSTPGSPTTSTPRGRSPRSTRCSPRSTRRSTPAGSRTASRRRLDAAFAHVDAVLGIVPKATDAENPDGDVDALVAERNAARKAREFARADAIRRELTARGIVLEDTPHGTVWHRTK